MIKYLSSGAVKPPTAVTPRLPAKPAAAGFVLPGFERGSLILKNQHGEYFRLSWEGDRARKERLALPAGTYTLTGYRLIRRDTDGKEWFLSATSHGIRHIEVRPGAEQRVALDDTIRIQRGLAPNGAQVQMMIQGEGHSGLSIYRNGKRIPIGYRITGEDGVVLAQGSMTYG